MSGDRALPPLTLQNPVAGTTIATSPETLGLDTKSEQAGPDSNVSKNPFKRTVDNTTDKMVRSKSLKAKNSKSPQGSPGSQFVRTISGHKRLFGSVRRQVKGKDRSSGGDFGSGDDEMTESEAASRPTSPSSVSIADESPFIRPPSPSTPAQPAWPSMEVFSGVGSMRAGTQTLIQALQAMPLAEDHEDEDEDEDIITPLRPNDGSESEDEDGHANQMASSIHAIHRPLAWSRRKDRGLGIGPSASTPPDYFPTIPDSLEDDLGSDEGRDYDSTTPLASSLVKLHNEDRFRELASPMSPILEGQVAQATRAIPRRSGSLATVRLKRRARLAEKLMEVFDLEGVEEVIAEMPCWLLRSVLLQGYMYLTNSHLCFFAHIPAREDQVLKSGSLSKKAQRTKRWIKHWFVLKNDALSWYHSSSDPYFPHGVVDLRYAVSCESVNEKDLWIRTNLKTLVLAADSIPSRDEWVKAIRRVIFKAQNTGDSVKISIPYSAILDVEKSHAMDFSETIEVKVVDSEDNSSIDSYFFAYFHDISVALDQIRDAVRAHRSLSETYTPAPVRDTTSPRNLPITVPTVIERVQTYPSVGHITKHASGFKLASLLRPFSSDAHPIINRATSAPPSSEKIDDFTYVSTRRSIDPNSTSFVPVTVSSTSSGQERSSSPEDSVVSSAWSVGMPSWLKVPSRRVFSMSSVVPNRMAPTAEVSEVYTTTSSGHTSSDIGYSILETQDPDPTIVDKFHSAFALDDKEVLLGYFPGYILRVLPVPGRLMISSSYFCFKSSGPLATRTRMMLPMRDILATQNSKPFRYGHHGLVVIVKGHEELFFEFNSEDRRAAFVTLLQHQMEDIQKRAMAGQLLPESRGKREALILEGLESTTVLNDLEPRPPAESTASLPAVMFTSTSSTFLTFKPAESLHFTFLTIGSRGDVQPYIALGKGLMAEGHRVRIATHREFKEWIESHDMEYGYVGGDPAELMRICAEHGMFTVSFLKETVQNFRGWLDDLLKTSWEACQNTDVLMESPSAMGGIHIAEALGIPYFRAFTMPWTRTRAYAHAFAVPEHKMGGGYNYMSYVMFDQVFWRATAGQINRWRRNVLGLGSTGLDKMEPNKVPFLYNFSPSVVPPPLDWPEWIRVTGYWFLDDADPDSKKWAPPLGLVDFIDSAHSSGKKVVYIGFGSVVVSNPEAMTRCVIEAIVQSGVHAILSKGWSDRLHVKKGVDFSEPEAPLPQQIFPVSSIPHDWLFKRIDAACHHGGAGTTGASLRAGIPTVIKPFFGDQYFWGDRVEALGIGTSVRKLTVEHLAEALVAATTDQKQVERARLLGEQIRSENGVATAIEAIYRDLEYARSLVKRRIHHEGVEDETEHEDSTRAYHLQTASPLSIPEHVPHSSADSSNSSGRDVHSEEDWSVISDQDDRRSSLPRAHQVSMERSPLQKRNSIAAAMKSVLPDTLSYSPGRRQSNHSS